MPRYFLSIDIGASSGRHTLGWVQDGQIVTEEIYRFPNGPVWRGDQLCWDIDAIFSHVKTGIAKCKEHGKVPQSIGIDTWGVDFVLLDEHDRLLGNAVCYRDARTNGTDAIVAAVCSDDELYHRTGIAKQPYNTIYQLAAVQRDTPQILAHAKTFLMLPDYMHFLLTGEKRQEYTNATTSGLVNAHTKDWDWELIQRLGFPQHLFRTLSKGQPTHDTACAFLCAANPGEICLSSGTWSLMGVVRDAPDTRPECRMAGFTNEGGYGGRFRFLKNIMGLWMIQCIRKELPGSPAFDTLAEMARKHNGFPGRVDVNDAAFLAPASMTQAVAKACRPLPPQNAGELLQCVYASLAECYGNTAQEIIELTGATYNTIRVVGGGSQNTYLNELTAKACGLPVRTGPAEATAIGNLTAQMHRN